MANKVEDLVNVILDSYNECDITARIDEENMLNKDILIEIIDEIRKVLFPGFFDNNKVRSEYLKFLVGERLEFIQYHLKKQVSNAFANQDVCRECSKAQAEEKAEEVVFEFLKKIPKIREYLNTDIQAAYDGDPAAYSTDEIIFCYPGVFAITVYRIAHDCGFWRAYDSENNDGICSQHNRYRYSPGCDCRQIFLYRPRYRYCYR